MIKSTCWKTYYNMLLMKNLGIKRKSPLKVKKINTLKNIFTNRKKEKKKQFKESWLQSYMNQDLSTNGPRRCHHKNAKMNFLVSHASLPTADVT